jgi:hypothetical protein
MNAFFVSIVESFIPDAWRQALANAFPFFVSLWLDAQWLMAIVALILFFVMLAFEVLEDFRGRF